MITSKNKILKPVIESKNGLHFTAYIKFDGDVLRFRKSLTRHLKSAKKHLSQVLSKEELKKFLAPVEALSLDSHTLKQMKGNIGIFRKFDFLKFVSLPMEINEICVVADSFHIKPLIKWAQQDQDFLVVGLTFDGAHLYKGNHTEVKKIDTVVYPESLRSWDEDGGYVSLKEKRKKKIDLQQTMDWLAALVEELTLESNTKVFVAGNKNYVKEFSKKCRVDNLYLEPIAPHFSTENAFEVCKNVRSLLRLDSIVKLNDTLKKFRLALDANAAKTNLFQIAKSAVSGKVEKLLVAEDFNVFGRLDKATGSIALHPTELNHEDDCILDDLTQTVLLNGGEVTVVKIAEIPRGLPLMAIIRGQSREEEFKTSPMKGVAV